jgi:phospholipid transport system substrate-binding protein
MIGTTRRIFLLIAFSLGTVLSQAPARAADPAQAAAFVKQTGNDLTTVVGDASTPAEKKRRLQPFIDKVADVNDVARFCLGRYWNRATPEQQREYTELFHRVLMNNVVGHMGDYKQTRINVILGRPELRDGLVNVPTTIEREGNPPAHVTWIVKEDGSSYRIIDVVAEGTSMRLTVRNDYNSFLNSHGGDVNALIQALRSQAAS